MVLWPAAQMASQGAAVARRVVGGLPCVLKRRGVGGKVGWRCLASSSSSSSGSPGGEDAEKKVEAVHEGSEDNAQGSNFHVVAADARADPTRRFTVSTGGASRKVPVFRDYTRNTDRHRERVMEHDTFVAHLPRAVLEYERESDALLRGTSVVRDQRNAYIDENDVTNRRWLEGGQASGTGRLSVASTAVMRKRAGLSAESIAEGGGVPEEGLTVEDKIQLSMAQGDFENLKGKGQPLERLNEGQYFHDGTSHKFMEVLSKAGMKPAWVERSGKIKDMHARLLRRLRGEWARVLLGAYASTGPTIASYDQLDTVRSKWRSIVEGSNAIQSDLSFVNHEIDTYNLQVPSINLQRVRLRLDLLLEAAQDLDESVECPAPFLTRIRDGSSSGGTPTWRIDVEGARLHVRDAEREGVMSPVTCLGQLRLETDDQSAHRSHTSSSYNKPRPTGRGTGGAGFMSSIMGWFTGGGGGGSGR